ncbi:restriction endonuclease subunit R [Vibrio tarriae]|uniref:DEAD/DEAH box helicase n=1 Tax=Vibrio tarriae TaxID=2014742 RepID=UPI000DE32AC1|nr:DEAD/DEAH box helicase family protein [Vibrio tarriae]RBM49287.1 restriction endonuclease subunit R [Vibrio tarriae]RBM69063.1 restriction endonuclease subunit R [Vibrio tarriae]
MFQLKGYQQRAVEATRSFLSHCLSSNNVEEAYKLALKEQELPEHAYRDYGFDQVPYFCLRIPTGGGKTVLGSHAIEVAAKHYLETETPIALWLVPSITIREQTVEALKTPGHPYRERLDVAFNRQVLVLDIDEVTQIRAQDIENKAIVIVSTLANLRVNDTTCRGVYDYKEAFEPHFSKLPANILSLPHLDRVAERDIQDNGLTSRDIGQVKLSFVNLLAIYRPIVIVDEAHNARTTLTFETLRRVHPSAIIELTATPNTTPTNGSNVLFHVSASELKAEEMIKLPIVLTEHQNWQDAIRDAVITRNKLQLDAQKDEDYIRPIALFQAENKKGEVTVDVLLKHLTKELGIDESKIAIATGSQRELDGIDLFAQDCPIEYIITIEALKEGWDCSFAYVFCSVKQVSSSKDAEQLLGRVLRMPYAKRRVIEDLNRAYAHLATSNFSKAAQELTDKLIAMGFEEMEIAAFLRERAATGGQGDLFGNNEPDNDQSNKPTAPKDIVVEVKDMPDVSSLSEEEKSKIKMTTDSTTNTTVIQITGSVTPDIQKVLSKHVPAGKKREEFERDVRIHNEAIDAERAPSERGEKFGSLPYLCMMEQGELELIESEVFLHANSWNLLNYPAELTNFSISETSSSFSIDMGDKKLSYKIAEQKEAVNFNKGFIDVTEQDLVRWLDRTLRQPDVLQHQLVGFLGQLVKKLLQNPAISLTALVRNKFPLARAIGDLISMYRKQAQKAGYQDSLFGDDCSVCISDEFMCHFSPTHYPSRPPYYSGRYKFDKHYFPNNQIEDMKSTGEEFECAQAIDSLPEVKHWIRNLVRRDHCSFWLPLAHGKFYPDFICELNDGRMLVVEYKGDALATSNDTAEKSAVGDLWANLSNGKCLFLMAVKKDKKGRNVAQQISELINK